MTGDWEELEGQLVDGRFRLRQFLAGAASSGVFETAYGEPETRKAAIKLISGSLSRVELALSRWRSARELSHPHLVRIFETGLCVMGGARMGFVVMEYAGEDLSQVLPERPLTPQETADMLGPVLDALKYLHANGFVHGHLKPSNVMAVDDRVKISSDRLYRAGEAVSGHAVAGVYDTPESGEGTASPASDLWSLGATVVEALTQHPPPRNRPLPALPAPFDEIATHCLDPDPRSRWSVAAIRRRLDGKSPRRWYVITAGALGLVAAVGVLASRFLTSPATVSPVAPVPSPAPPPKAAVLTPPAPVKSQENTRRPSAAAVAHEVVPQIPAKVRETIRGTVRVRVRVSADSSGKVRSAKLASKVQSRYFARRALDAAARWKFKPPAVDGQSLASEWTLNFAFNRTGTRVVPVKISP